MGSDVPDEKSEPDGLPVFIGAHDWLYQLHHRWFHLSTEHFDALHYAGMAVYKIGILIFNLVPMVACFLIS
ncbi:DUF6868 family protein [Acidithiobacillus sp.]|uniref:DUF6868 family protein n=1 Tax=Acidithiobacillus sp. TaxID=1872118 RepID=UPI00338FBFD3